MISEYGTDLPHMADINTFQTVTLLDKTKPKQNKKNQKKIAVQYTLEFDTIQWNLTWL